MKLIAQIESETKMTIKVRLFAALREAMGRDHVELSLSAGATPEDV